MQSQGQGNRFPAWWAAVLTVVVLSGVIPATRASEVAASRVKAAKPATPTMVILGASYARDWGIEQAGRYRVVNKGVDGNQTHEMLARFDSDVIKQRPSTVLIWGFINDIFRSSREGVTEKLGRTRENIKAMLAKSQAAGITPILATEVTMTTRDSLSEKLAAWFGKLRGKQGYHEYVNRHVLDVNAWIREIARERKIVLLDFERVLANDQGERQRRYAIDDGSHLTRAAYAALTDHASQELASK